MMKETVIGRNVRVDELDGSFGAAQPGSGSESAKNAERLQAAEASRMHWEFAPSDCTLAGEEFNGAYPRAAGRQRRTHSGIQK